ncbi:uncharacterized protein LOC123557040 [Mercenaria mercenaria]|uniref:uncharacterized protein LOC123557040 n=1 Tax=Mercenaria mercenaria TaxID=6596 RepID=UPI001E1D34C5|nr:uncharacterized protein LOC123557040 [Mercenaria mercenaria]
MTMFTLVVILFITAGIHADTEKSELQTITDDLGNILTANITHKTAEDDIALVDDEGNPVIKVDVFELDGYQIDKPANESVCLLSEITESENGTLCYDRIDYPKTNLTQNILDHCDGRTIYLLVPKVCDLDEINSAVTETPPGTVPSRRKRSWRCFWRIYYTLRCYSVSRCCGWFCRRRCHVRYEYRLVKVYYFWCGYRW